MKEISQPSLLKTSHESASWEEEDRAGMEVVMLRDSGKTSGAPGSCSLPSLPSHIPDPHLEHPAFHCRVAHFIDFNH